MQSLISNPKRILDVIGWHLAKPKKLQVNPFLFIQDGEDYYCLKVSGDSMSSSTIKAMSDSMANSETDESEMVLVRRTEKIRNDDIILAVVDGEPMLKRYKKFRNRIELHPTNELGFPIVITEENDFRVAGVFVGHFNEN